MAMEQTIFRTTRASIEVVRKMIDEANGEHKKTLKTISDSYKGDMFIKMRDRENSEHKARLDDLRKVAYRDICEEIGKVREQISLKTQKRDFKALNELASLSGLHLSQAEFNLLYKQYSKGNYWNIRRLAEIAQEQGLNMPEPFAPIDKQIDVLNEMQENCRLFLFGTDEETAETFNRFGHNQVFSGYGSPDGAPNTYEQMLCVSEAEFNRLESIYTSENPLFTEGALIDEVVRGLAAVDGSMNKMHYLNNRLHNMTKEQIAETVSELSKSNSSEVQLALSLSDFGSVMADMEEK